MTRTASALAAALSLSACWDATPRPEEVRYDCRAVDGDTLRCSDLAVRLRGVDTPELHSKCDAERSAAQHARERLAQLAAAGIALRPIEKDRYGRVVALVVTPQGENLAVILIREQLGRAYGGRAGRGAWCDADGRIT